MAWQQLSDSDTKDLLASMKFDLDFVAVVGPIQELLANDSIRQLTSNSSVKICATTSIHIARTKEFGRMFLYAKLNDWLLGEPIPRGQTDFDIEDECSDVDEENEAPSNNLQVSDTNLGIEGIYQWKTEKPQPCTTSI